jgi:hypothetical protein
VLDSSSPKKECAAGVTDGGGAFWEIENVPKERMIAVVDQSVVTEKPEPLASKASVTLRSGLCDLIGQCEPTII